MKAKWMLFFLFAVLFIGCEEDSDFWRESSGLYKPKCTVSSVQKIDKGPDQYFPEIKVTVSNSEDGAAAYNVGGTIKFKRGDLIVDRCVMALGTLKRGEGIMKECKLSMDSHSEYNTIVISLQWSDINGRVYQRDFQR